MVHTFINREEYRVTSEKHKSTGMKSPWCRRVIVVARGVIVVVIFVLRVRSVNMVSMNWILTSVIAAGVATASLSIVRMRWSIITTVIVTTMFDIVLMVLDDSSGIDVNNAGGRRKK